MKKLLLWAVLGTALTACIDFNKQAMNQKIVQISNSLEAIQQGLDSLKLQSLQDIQQKLIHNELQIVQLYHDDTLSENFAQTMSDYKIIKEKLPAIIKVQISLDSSLQVESKQLYKLKKDIKNGAGRRDKYTTYIAQEEKNVALLHHIYSQLLKEHSTIVHNFNRLTPKIYALIDYLGRT
jgi:hypothetical protein